MWWSMDLLLSMSCVQDHPRLAEYVFKICGVCVCDCLAGTLLGRIVMMHQRPRVTHIIQKKKKAKNTLSVFNDLFEDDKSHHYQEFKKHWFICWNLRRDPLCLVGHINQSSLIWTQRVRRKSFCIWKQKNIRTCKFNSSKSRNLLWSNLVLIPCSHANL